MADPTLALQVHPIGAPNQLQSVQRAISVADMLSQMSERQQTAKLRQADTQLKEQKIASEKKAIEDQQALDSAVDANLTYDETLGDIKIDHAGVAASLKQMNRLHMLPQFKDAADKYAQNSRDRALKELEDAHKMTDTVGVPAENFLALPEEERAAQYPALVQNLSRLDPRIRQQLPPQYGPDALTKVTEIRDHRNQILTTTQKLKEAQDREKLAALADDQLTPEQRWDKYNKGVAMPAWYRNFVTAEKTRPGSGKVPSGAAVTERKLTTLSGKDVPEDAETREGDDVPASWRLASAQVEQRQDNDGRVFYQITAPAKQTDKQREADRIEKGYAFSIGKTFEDLTDKDRVDAQVWYKGRTPRQMTNIEKRIELYSKDPHMYGELFGRGNPDELKPAQRATILGRINTEIGRLFLEGKEAEDFRKARMEELKEAGIDLTAPPPKGASPQVKGATVTRQQLEASAKRNQITVAEAEARLKAAGVTVK